MPNLKKIALSLVAILTLGNLAYAGGDIAPVVEPIIEESPVTNQWEFRLSPYVWIAGFKGDVAGIPGFPPTSIDISTSDALDDTEIALMAMFEAKKNGKGFLMDFMYSDIESEEAIAGPLSLTSQTKTTIVSGAYLHEIYNEEQSVVDVFAGVRYWKIDSHLALIGPGAGHKESWVDPLIGIKGRTALGDTKFYASAGASIGGFGLNSDLFYDINANFGYQWSDSIGTSVGYRMYDLDYENDGFVYDVRQEGWILGLTWAF
jgi:hypothetical protein